MRLSSRSAGGPSGRGEAVGVTWQRVHHTRANERTAWNLRAAERAAAVTAARYRGLRAASPGAGDAPVPRDPLPTWQQLLLVVVGGGLLFGLLVGWLLVAAYVGPAAMLVPLAAAGLVAAFCALLGRRRPMPSARRRRPLVADLVRATQELHDAEAALQRIRGEHRSASDPSTGAQALD